MGRVISFFLVLLLLLVAGYAIFVAKNSVASSTSNAAEENLAAFGFQNWHEFTSPSGDFKVMFPSLPQHVADTLADKNSGEERKYDMFVSEKSDGSIFMINVITFSTPPDEKKKEQLRQTMLNDVLKSNEKNRLLQAETMMFKDYKALSYTVENAEMNIDAKVFVTDSALYALTRLVKKEHYNQKEFDFFTNSFDLSRH